MTVLVRDIKYHSISTEQLQVLLGYVEQDIHDHTRQATAFSLLKVSLGRSLLCWCPLMFFHISLMAFIAGCKEDCDGRDDLLPLITICCRGNMYAIDTFAYHIEDSFIFTIVANLSVVNNNGC